MTVFIVVTKELCAGTDFPATFNAVPFRRKNDADVFYLKFIAGTKAEDGIVRSAFIFRRNVK